MASKIHLGWVVSPELQKFALSLTICFKNVY